MKKKICTIVGGSNGIGACLATQIYKNYETVNIIDIQEPITTISNLNFIKFDLYKDEILNLKQTIENTDDLILTAGIGRVDFFKNLSIVEIKKNYSINLISIASLLNFFSDKLFSKDSHNCMVFGSIAGDICSPLFSVYGSSKAGLNMICESINIELDKTDFDNRITCIKPLSFNGSSFNGGKTNINELTPLANSCLAAMYNHLSEFYPDESIEKDILGRYHQNKFEFGKSSFDYKILKNRLNKSKSIKVGYLSGTFDLFHIGHLNLLKNAKRFCDFLVVGVHKDASHKGKETFIPFKERLAIVESCKYVDLAIESEKEDSDAWSKIKYDYLFVGSDYKGTERFLNYEKFFSDKNVKIIYFPYTNGTSSTMLRDALQKK